MPSRSRTVSPWRRFAIRLLAVCVLGLLGGAGWLVGRPPAAIQLTSYGIRVSNAAPLLAQAERAMTAEVRARHGAKARDARCYFSTVAGAGDAVGPTDSRPTAIGDRLFCGPVLFVDGDPDRPYLTFDLVAGSSLPDGGIRLALASLVGEPDAADPRPASLLVRPDGKQPGPMRLTPPPPPAAVGDVLTTASTLRTPLTPAPPDAQMVGQVSGIRLVEYGFVASYGWGDRARRAPAGYRLLAFATDQLPGELADQLPDLSVRVDGQERGPLTQTSDYLVTAVPLHARSVDLVLTDSGLKQSISLLTGRPNGPNPVVTTRIHQSQQLLVSRAIRVRLKTRAGTGMLDGTLTLRALSLTYWAADGSQCGGIDRAWLHVAATVKLEGDQRAYGAEAGLITVQLPGSGRLSARNAAVDPAREVDDVIDVPASATVGELSYSGTLSTSKGTITVLTPVTIPFEIPAG
ncbi:MAG TPA: hypothetical protein VJ851_16995 [Jatrophihabitans sp.]|nr:hypothetical protein [Jatrophihabitans sp.]